jgi:hypothetical protein
MEEDEKIAAERAHLKGEKSKLQTAMNSINTLESSFTSDPSNGLHDSAHRQAMIVDMDDDEMTMNTNYYDEV